MLKVDEEGVPRLVQRIGFYKGALQLGLFNNKTINLSGDYVILPEGIDSFGVAKFNDTKEYMHDLYYFSNKYIEKNLKMWIK